MKMQMWFGLFIFIFDGISNYGKSVPLLTKFENCDKNANDSIKFNVTIKTVGNKQYLDGVATSMIAIDNNLRSNISVDMLVGKRFVYLFSINERKSCDALHKYMGEFVYELERTIGLIPGMCPIPKGRYNVHNYWLDFEKITTLSRFPYGTLRFTDIVYDRKNNYCYCVAAEGENRL